jgi:ribonuclease Z|nr:MAG: ribonuclease Z [Pseudomonadota bacterium]
MPLLFNPLLVNDPFGDPGLFIDLTFERRALLFDLGDLTPLPTRKVLRISDIFVSHRHMDHFAGFDHLLRLALGREQTINIYGYYGLIDAIAHKLSAYTWNLTRGYPGNLRIKVHELDNNERLTTTEFESWKGFAPGDKTFRESPNNILLQEPRFRVQAAVLDHGIPSLAFALEETIRINVWRNKVEDMGLKTGPWLRELKEAVARGDPADTLIEVEWREPNTAGPAALPLGQLRNDVLEIAPGRKIAYVVDVAFTPTNAEKILGLVRGAEILFIETPFLHEDHEQARSRHHLTARQAGTLARQAGVKRIVPLHFSPRYSGRGHELEREALAAFRGME